MPINGLGLPCLQEIRDHFLLVARSDHTTGSRNIKEEIVLKVQKMAQYASFCLVMGPFKGEVPVLADYGLLGFGFGLGCFTTGAIWSAILATAGLLVLVNCATFCKHRWLRGLPNPVAI